MGFFPFGVLMWWPSFTGFLTFNHLYILEVTLISHGIFFFLTNTNILLPKVFIAIWDVNYTFSLLIIPLSRWRYQDYSRLAKWFFSVIFCILIGITNSSCSVKFGHLGFSLGFDLFGFGFLLNFLLV